MWTKNFKIKYKILISGAICAGENNEKYVFLPPQFEIGNNSPPPNCDILK